MARPTHNISEVSSIVYLGIANRVLRKDVFKPRSIAIYNLTHKVAKYPYVKLDIRKPFNNQSSTLSLNVIRSLWLNTHNQPSPTNISKSSRSVTKLSHLKARKSAHQKLHHDCGDDTNNVSLQIKSSMVKISCQEVFIFVVMLMRIFAFTHLFEQEL